MNILGTEQDWSSNFTVEQLRGLASQSIGSRCTVVRRKEELIRYIRQEWARRLRSTEPPVTLNIEIRTRLASISNFISDLQRPGDPTTASRTSSDGQRMDPTPSRSVGQPIHTLRWGEERPLNTEVDPSLDRVEGRSDISRQPPLLPPMPVQVPVSPLSNEGINKFSRWLKIHNDKIHFDISYLNMYSKALGDNTLMNLNVLYQWCVSRNPSLSAQIDSMPQVHSSITHVVESRTTGQSWSNLQRALAHLFVDLSKGHQFPDLKTYITDKGGPPIVSIKAEMVQTTPLNGVRGRGVISRFKFLIEYDGVKFHTGLWGLAQFGIEELIAIDGKPISDIVNLYSKWSTEETRKLAYWIVRSRLNPSRIRYIPDGRDTDRGLIDREVRDQGLVDPLQYIGNLGQIAADAGLDLDDFRYLVKTTSSPPNLSRGALCRLYQWLNQNPRVYEANKSKTPLIPYRIEDCLEPRLLPPELSRYFGPVKVVENPYLLIASSNLDRITQIRDIQTDIPTRAEALNRYDQIMGPWLIDMLKLTPEQLMNHYQRSSDREKSRNLPKLAYYCACRGLAIPDHNSEIWTLNSYYRICLAACEFYDAGDGLEATAGNARPYPRLFVDAVCIANMSSGTSSPDKILWCTIFGMSTLVGLLSRSDIANIMTRGYIFPLPIDPTVYARYNMYQTLTEAQKDLMSRIYNNPTMTATDFSKIRTPILLETCITDFTEETVVSWAEYLGMVFPLQASTIVLQREYFFESISAYSHLVNTFGTFRNSQRTGPVRELTDLQILLLLGGQVVYNTRSQLERLAVDMLSTSPTIEPRTRHFFVPFQRRPLNPRTLTSLEETQNREMFLVAFGTARSYVCHEIAELAGYMAPSESGVYRYTILGLNGKYEALTPTQAMELRLLISGLEPRMRSEVRKESQQLIQQLDRVGQALRVNNTHDRTAIQQFHKFGVSTRGLVRQYLDRVFELGMYMRRWKGPGNPYPLQEAETIRADFDPDTDLKTPITGVWEAIKKLDSGTQRFVRSLRMVVFKDGRFTHSVSKTLSGIYEQAFTVDDEQKICIRMASAELVGSSYYYIDLLYSEVIQGFDPTRLALIM